MKRKIPVICIILVFLIGVSIMLYPLVSAMLNNMDSRKNADAYMNEAQKMDEPEVDEAIQKAVDYNNRLANNVILTDPFDEEAYTSISKDYEEALNTGANGLIGYIDVPKINVYLPIYHGTSEDILAMGAGHLANTSLPVGGIGTHSVISAHTGYPTETFFDYLTDLKEGDSFYIHILTKTLKYEVDQIKVVYPEDTSDLYVVDGEDYVTLLTCTPYGINTQRLLVRGTRVPNDEIDTSKDSVKAGNISDGSLYVLGFKIPFWLAGTVLLTFIGIVVIVVVLLIRRKKRTAQASG